MKDRHAGRVVKLVLSHRVEETKSQPDGLADRTVEEARAAQIVITQSTLTFLLARRNALSLELGILSSEEAHLQYLVCLGSH